jgi:hypothetical protein
MRKFDLTEEGSAEKATPQSERLEQFWTALWARLEPADGAASIQARLMHANARVYLEHMRNGAGTYYEVYDKGEWVIGDGCYLKLLVFLLDTLVANHNNANREEDVAYFRELRQAVQADRLFQRASVDFEELHDRAVRCIANFCISNPDPVDQEGTVIAGASLRPLLVTWAAWS